MRILYIIDHFEPHYPRDQNYIIRYMMEKGYEVTVITSYDAKFRDYDSVFFPKISIIRAPLVGCLKKAKIYFHPTMLREIFDRFDVVHAFTFFTTSSILGAIPNADIKILRSEVGSPDDLTFIKSMRRMTLYSVLVKAYRELYDYVTAYNHIEAESLRMLGFDKQKIIILSPMIDYPSFSRLSETSMQVKDEIVLGCVARLSPEKGIHRLIPLFKDLSKRLQHGGRSFHMILAGRIDYPSYGHFVLSELRRLLGDRFTYLGEIAPPFKFYKVVDVVIIPSITETGAISVLEAMASGKIVIASDIYPINLYIKNGVNGFLFKKISEASETIASILSGSVNIEYLKRNAKNRAKVYDYKLVCSKLEYVYKFGKSNENLGR